MRGTLLAGTLLATIAGGAHAAGVERSAQSMSILFEEGRHARLSFRHADPDVTGTIGPLGSGEVVDSFSTVSLGYKMSLGEQFDMAVILDQPIGSAISYPTGTGYPLAGTTASIDSTAVTGVLRYRASENFSLHGGVRLARTRGEVTLNFPHPRFGPVSYRMDTSNETDAGYLVGVAYERPDIALRVALTYNSPITHDFDATETSPISGGRPNETGFETTIPESVNLEFQTGIAQDTLLFGSVRWVNWPDFDISPQDYATLTGGESLVYFRDETVTYNLGLGRRFNENWSGAVTVGYETRMDPSEGMGNLGPVDGRESVGVALTYTEGDVSITGGVRYVALGDTDTRSVNGRFKDNDALGFGVEIGVSF